MEDNQETQVESKTLFEFQLPSLFINSLLFR